MSIVMLIVVTVLIVFVPVMTIDSAELFSHRVGWVAGKYIACPCLRNQALGVGEQQKPLAHQFPGGACHCTVVSLLAAVRLFERKPRIAVCHALDLTLCKGFCAPNEGANLTCVGAGCGDVPTEIGRERCLCKRRFDPCYFIAVRIYLRDQCRSFSWVSSLTRILSALVVFTKGLLILVGVVIVHL